MNSLGNDNRIAIFESLDDPGQPYTCTQWGNLGQEGIPVVVEPNYQYQIWEWFSIESYFGMIVILDPNMVYRYYGSDINEIYSTCIDSSDEIGLALRSEKNYNIKFISGSEENIKITNKSDLDIIESLLKNTEATL